VNFDKLQQIDRRILYVILVISVAITLFAGRGTEIPVFPDDSSKDLYIQLMESPADKPIFIQSDWTNSTRGESRGQMVALLRIIMSQDKKFVVFSMGDPQAPQVARDAIRLVNEERRAEGLREYKTWEDYIEMGNFPNAENSLNALGNNIRTAWGPRRRRDSEGRERSVFESPVLQGVQKVNDCGAYVVVTASQTIDFAVERISDKVQLNGMVTGVVGPTVLPYKRAGQIKGLRHGVHDGVRPELRPGRWARQGRVPPATRHKTAARRKRQDVRAGGNQLPVTPHRTWPDDPGHRARQHRDVRLPAR
jgi:hypothetical protein